MNIMKLSELEMKWGRFAYRTQGTSGIPIIFLHGTGCDCEDWEKIMPLLPHGQYMIFPEFRGHGNSQVPKENFTIGNLAEDLIHLTEHLKLNQFYLLGHSLGGMVSLEVARRCNMARGLILLEGWTRLSVCGNAFDKNHMFGYMPVSVSDEIRRKSKSIINSFQADAWKYFWESVKNFDAFDFLQNSNIPILEIYGMCGYKGSRNLLQVPERKNISLEFISGVGHYPAHEKPDETVKLIWDWLKENK